MNCASPASTAVTFVFLFSLFIFSAASHAVGACHILILLTPNLHFPQDFEPSHHQNYTPDNFPQMNKNVWCVKISDRQSDRIRDLESKHNVRALTSE